MARQSPTALSLLHPRPEKLQPGRVFRGKVGGGSPRVLPPLCCLLCALLRCHCHCHCQATPEVSPPRAAPRSCWASPCSCAAPSSRRGRFDPEPHSGLCEVTFSVAQGSRVCQEIPWHGQSLGLGRAPGAHEERREGLRLPWCCWQLLCTVSLVPSA